MTGPVAPRRARRSRWSRRVLPVLLLVVLLAGGVLTWNLLDDGEPGNAAAPATSTAAPADPQQPDPGATPEPTGSPEPITGPRAAPVVVREGVPESARTVEAATVDFAATAEWADGASVRVVEAAQRVTAGRGPGELAGQPQTVFTLELSNGTGAPLVLDGVVVQAAYGDGPVQAGPLYDDASVDFGGTVEPGATATAVYSFAVPGDALGDVTLTVDVDGYRFPAVFTGAVPVR